MWAPWCGPCRMLKPVFERVAQNNSTDVQMYTLNIDENRDTAVKYGVRSIPTIKVFNMGQDAGTIVGVLSESQINNLLKEVING